jgi:hypothetical protein
VKHLVFNTAVQWLASRLYNLRFKSRQRKQIFYISITSNLVLVLTQWVYWGSIPGLKWLGVMTTDYHLEPVLIMCGTVPPIPLTCFHRMHRDKFTFFTFPVYCVRFNRIPQSASTCIIYCTLFKYHRRCKIHLYFYCSVGKTFYIVIRLNIVMKACVF